MNQMDLVSAEFIDDNLPWAATDTLHLGNKNLDYVHSSQRAYVGICRNYQADMLVQIVAYDEYVCFQEIKIVGDNVVIGFGESVYFINTGTKASFPIKLDGYFSEMYLPKDFELPASAFYLLVASSNSLYHFDLNGKELWNSELLGIDGVLVHDVKPPTIRVSGEWDPPGGWEERILSLSDGAFWSE